MKKYKNSWVSLSSEQKRIRDGVINKKVFVEDLLKKTKYYYDSGNKDCEALKFYIGKDYCIFINNFI